MFARRLDAGGSAAARGAYCTPNCWCRTSSLALPRSLRPYGVRLLQPLMLGIMGILKVGHWEETYFTHTHLRYGARQTMRSPPW